MSKLHTRIMPVCIAILAFAWSPLAGAQDRKPGQNPLFTDVFTADPAPLVVRDTLYLYVGHDEAREHELFTMKDWLVFSTKDMKHWTPHGPIMKATDFKWATGDAWASQVAEDHGKFYFYAAVKHDKTHPGMAVGVAVSDSPLGPFTDARGSALISDDMTPHSKRPWSDIDPTIFTDVDGTHWLMWGNGDCYLARLKPNMIELDGEIRKILLPDYTEGPWLHKRGSLYYLTYASIDEKKGGAERIAYATATQVTGPWSYRGLITGTASNSYTIHPGIIEFNGQWYLFYHNATLAIGDQKGATGRRAVAVEYLHYNEDGTIRPIEQTTLGVSIPPREHETIVTGNGSKR